MKSLYGILKALTLRLVFYVVTTCTWVQIGISVLEKPAASTCNHPEDEATISQCTKLTDTDILLSQ